MWLLGLLFIYLFVCWLVAGFFQLGPRREGIKWWWVLTGRFEDLSQPRVSHE